MAHAIFLASALSLLLAEAGTPANEIVMEASCTFVGPMQRRELERSRSPRYRPRSRTGRGGVRRGARLGAAAGAAFGRRPARPSRRASGQARALHLIPHGQPR
jgi:hypothetical protein